MIFSYYAGFNLIRLWFIAKVFRWTHGFKIHEIIQQYGVQNLNKNVIAYILMFYLLFYFLYVLVILWKSAYITKILGLGEEKWEISIEIT